jgi:hypothetical protein
VEVLPIVNALKGFGHGLIHLSDEWLRLREALTTRGFLCPHDANLGIRMLGVLPRGEALAQHEDGFLFALLSCGCPPVRPVDTIENMLRPENRPSGLRDVPAEELLPDPATCREQLIQWIDEERADLAAAQERAWVEVDAPAQARILDPAALVIDPAEAQRFDRAGRLYQSIFYRAHNTLEAMEIKEARARAAERPPRGAAGAKPADIKAPVPGVSSVPEPSTAPDAVTEVVAPERVEASNNGQEPPLQNEPRNGPPGTAGHPPEARRSCHKTVAKKAVKTIVRRRSRRIHHKEHPFRKE